MRRVIFVTLAELLVCFGLSFIKLPYTDRLTEIVYGICGILFSVAMSQVMTFDLSKIVDEDIYNTMALSLVKIKKYFFIQFFLASLAFVLFQTLKTDKNSMLVFCPIQTSNTICDRMAA